MLCLPLYFFNFLRNHYAKGDHSPLSPCSKFPVEEDDESDDSKKSGELVELEELEEELDESDEVESSEVSDESDEELDELDESSTDSEEPVLALLSSAPSLLLDTLCEEETLDESFAE